MQGLMHTISGPDRERELQRRDSYNIYLHNIPWGIPLISVSFVDVIFLFHIHISHDSRLDSRKRFAEFAYMYIIG